MNGVLQAQTKNQDADINDGNWVPSAQNGSSDQSMEVATQCPPCADPGGEAGPAHLGAALYFLSGKSHTYQFSLAEKCSESWLGQVRAGVGCHRMTLGAKPPTPWFLQLAAPRGHTATHLARHSLGLGPGPR